MKYLYSSQYDPMMNSRISGQAINQAGMPYFPLLGAPYAPVLAAAGTPDLFEEEKRVFEDARRLQSFYPRIAQEIQQHVEEECDKLEYEGSMMFDEYPDRVLLMRLAEKITDQLKDFSVEEALRNPETAMAADRMEEAFSEEEAFLPEENTEQMERLTKPQVLSGQSGNRRRRREDFGLGDLVQVMLLDEMHRRRCRHRRCQNRRFW